MAVLKLRLFGVLVLAGSCGDALVGESYRGQPLFRIETELVRTTAIRSSDKPFRVSVFWTKNGDTDVSAGNLVEQPSVAVDLAFPGRFKINIFQPPAGEGLLAVEGHRVGLLLIYEDLDEDGRYDHGELRGGAFDRVLLHVPAAVEAASSITGERLAAGYNLARNPILCSCGVNLGAACADDAACGPAGQCAKDTGGFVFPNGMCVAESKPDCLPRGSMILGDFIEQGKTHAVKACRVDADCRVAEGYVCCANLCFPDDPGNVCTDPTDCTPPTGGPCSSNQACGANGFCVLESDGTEYPNGLCAIKPTDSCWLEEATSINVSDPETEADMEVWVPTCRADSDCRTAEGYVCDFGECSPAAPLLLAIFEDFAPQPLCQPSPSG